MRGCARGRLDRSPKREEPALSNPLAARDTLYILSALISSLARALCNLWPRRTVARCLRAGNFPARWTSGMLVVWINFAVFDTLVTWRRTLFKIANVRVALRMLLHLLDIYTKCMKHEGNPRGNLSMFHEIISEFNFQIYFMLSV